MMNQALLLPKHADRQLVYSGINWQQFKLIQAGFAEASGIRLAYFNGTIETLMPGRTSISCVIVPVDFKNYKTSF